METAVFDGSSEGPRRMMRLPVRIFSDLHLGHRASRISDVEALRPLLQGAGTVVLNGDTWEELAAPWRERSAEMLETLKGIAGEEGCETIFLRGNHDPGWAGPGYLSLAEGRVIVTHGDALLRNSSPWKRELLSGSKRVEEIWKRHPGADTDVESRMEIAREIATHFPSRKHPDNRSILTRAMDAAFPPRRTMAMISAWMNQGEHAADFCKAYFPKAEFLVIGHFHWPCVRQTRGRIVINTGSFVVPSRASWVEWDGNSMKSGKIRERHGRCSMEPGLNCWKLFHET